MNLAEAFESAANGPILATTLSPPYDHRYDDTQPDYVGKILSWDTARVILDYEYNNGYGGADCHAVYVLTETQVLFVGEYDGSTGISQVPRNPTEGTPAFSGE